MRILKTFLGGASCLVLTQCMGAPTAPPKLAADGGGADAVQVTDRGNVGDGRVHDASPPQDVGVLRDVQPAPDGSVGDARKDGAAPVDGPQSPDARSADAAGPDARSPDGGLADGRVPPDGSAADLAVPDQGPVDATPPDAGPRFCVPDSAEACRESIGACSPGQRICTAAGTWGPCEGDIRPTAELCNGLDDDCDGTVDEDYVVVGACGVGECRAHSVASSCIDGRETPCAAAPSQVERCDGLDNDCDGVVDNGEPEANQPCNTAQLGVCAAGTTVCSAGGVRCDADLAPSDEICDGLDNDCDGEVDEAPAGGALARACYDGAAATAGVGICHGGTQTCAAGAYGACVGQVAPGVEICDGLDNNCDGSTDNLVGGSSCACEPGQQRACYSSAAGTSGVGACHAGSQTCNADGLGWGACTGEVVPGVEQCNGRDDDCNGTVDDVPGAGIGCASGVGECLRAGTIACNAATGQLLCNAALGQPAAETCDGRDNDCDGVVDNGSPGSGDACNTGLLGACSEGLTSCQDGRLDCVQQRVAGPETCDGVDNDCNGAVDNGNPGGGVACVTGLPGLCAPGMTMCRDGRLVCLQNAQPVAETCNGLDDDCDGVVDNGNPGGGAACGTGLPGVCAAGTITCTNGALVCIQNVQPSAEICDGIDNDCNGMVDEGLGNATCGLGACQRTVASCVNGQPNTCTPGNPSTEVCDGIDNNCDGTVDEGNPGGGLACNTGLLGVCAAGTTVCAGGALVCAQNLTPSAELCDGLDNNCNGAVDEGNPGGGVACNTGKPGVCAAGTTACQSGSLVCNQNVQPSAEVCDGLDNNCDGVVDNGAGCANGVACATGNQCASGFCMDNVCCNAACGGLCQACSAAKKGSGANGACGNIAAGTDPDNECAGNLNCNGAGVCQ